jgi:YggT family protein
MIVFQIISALLTIFSLLILGRVLLSWMPNIDRYHPIVQFIYNTTEPVLQPIRQMFPPSQTGGMDVAPLVVFVAIYILQIILPG